ncbi:MAG: helix-turn-helix transcriptional regulator [Desulfurococcales archaeon]|nr:helix-turn-helix transcriptional regulator [Desulfurococcales archaeon]
MGGEGRRRPVTGTAFKIYLTLLNSRRSLGVREIQHLVGLKSPSTVKYHLDRLMKQGLVKQLPDGKYVAVKADNPALSGYILIMNTPVPTLIPAAVGYAVFVLTYSFLTGNLDPVLILSSLIFAGYSFYEGLRTRKLLKYLSGRG